MSKILYRVLISENGNWVEKVTDLTFSEARDWLATNKVKSGYSISRTKEFEGAVEGFVGVPLQVWEDLRYEIARSELECADNFRAYRHKDKKFFNQFMEAKDKGCCGCFESNTLVDGEKWIIGCNYGH